MANNSMDTSKSKYPFNYQLGKLYRYNGKEEKIFSFNNNITFAASIKNGDVIMFLKEPDFNGEKTTALYCKVLNGSGLIGEIFWDDKTYNTFTTAIW